jgi:uncharacterized membrane protein (DUF4010 family)
MQAKGSRFAIACLAVVALPLLPEGPYFGAVAFRPRALWAVVLVFVALNVASYAARRAVGSSKGYGIAGALGGLLSSTAVALTYSRRSAETPALSIPLARGVIGACTVLIPRILVISAVLNPDVAVAALRVLLPAFVIGSLFVAAGFRDRMTGAEQADQLDNDPLRLLLALQMAIAFQLAMSLVAWVRPVLGEVGLYGTAAVLGLTDMDALTVSMGSRTSGIDSGVAAKALGLGVLANTLFKAGLVGVLGRGAFRRRAALGLGLTAFVTLIAIAAA